VVPRPETGKRDGRESGCRRDREGERGKERVKKGRERGD
jgi:hypothetical protein